MVPFHPSAGISGQQERARQTDMSHLISFEGIEGCGKTTQLKLAAKFLRKSHIPVLTTEEPGGTPLGQKIRKLLLNRGSFDICAEAEMLLFVAARAQHCREVLRPALARGQWILCDRFSDATVVYQGFVRGIDDTWIRKLDTFATSSLKPRLTLLFDLPAETGLRRAMQRMTGIPENSREDRFEQEGQQGQSYAGKVDQPEPLAEDDQRDQHRQDHRHPHHTHRDGQSVDHDAALKDPEIGEEQRSGRDAQAQIEALELETSPGNRQIAEQRRDHIVAQEDGQHGRAGIGIPVLPELAEEHQQIGYADGAEDAEEDVNHVRADAVRAAL